MLAFAFGLFTTTKVLSPLSGEVLVGIWYAGSRYPDGSSPVAIHVPGADSRGNLTPPSDLWTDQGFVVVKFMFPGGVDPVSGDSSQGIYDHRGPACIRALYEVVRFCQGEITDIYGRTISQLVGHQVDPANVGLLGLSNGGNISVVLLANYGDSLAHPVWFVGWENPTNSQLVCIDLAMKDLDTTRDGDGDGCVWNDYKNPRYISYGDSSLVIDYSQIAWDPNLGLFLDGNSNGRPDSAEVAPGIWTFDLDSSGLLETDEDFALVAYTDTGGVLMYSLEATKAAMEAGVLSPWPDSIGDTADARAFWSLRDASLNYDRVKGLVGALLAFSVWDHVQPHEDKPHIHQAYDGFTRNGYWVRLCPDEAYSSYVLPSGGPYPDNPANWEPSDWSTIESYAYPEDVPSEVLYLAGCLEMADRTHYGVWDPNLDGVITGIQEGTGASLRWDGRTLSIPSGLRGTVRVYDAAGRLVVERDVRGGGETAELSLPRGVYIVRLAGRSLRVLLSR